MAAILKVLSSLGMSFLSEYMIKRIIYRCLKAAAEYYRAKAAKTQDKGDDALATMFLSFVRDVQIAFKIES